MYGEVYVPYTGIGGTNLDSGIMAADVTGSSAEGTEGQTRPSYNVSWSLPGGITNGTGGQGGEWGYIFQAMVDGGSVVGDAEMLDHLQSMTLVSWDGENPNSVVLNDETGIRTEINVLLNKYVRRLMQYSTSNPGDTSMGMTRFLQEFQGCVSAM